VFGSRRDDLEARVARLERLLDRVLVLLQELRKADRSPTEGALTGLAGREVQEEPVPVDPGVPGEAPIPVEKEVPEPVGARAHRRGAEDKSEADSQAGLAGVAEGKPGGRFHFLANRWGTVSGGAFLSRIGIALLLLSVAYFFKYSIDQGWLTEWVRLLTGLVAGSILAALGFRGASKGEPLGTVLAGGGIATFFITGFVGHQWFELVSYPLAFGFLVASSAFGIYLALRSGLQALGIVGLIGALATPLLLTSPDPDAVGLALYVSIIVAAVITIYMARGWRALLILAVVTAWLALSPAVDLLAGVGGTEAWAIQGALTFYVLAFWVAPLGRTVLRTRDPDRWTRPERTSVPWNGHLDALSLLVPLVGILTSGWLWELSRLPLGVVFFGMALLALALGYWLSHNDNPEDAASTQRFVALLLATVGLGLVLEGDILYLAFVAEAAALLVIGSRRESVVLIGLGGVVEAIVLGIFLFRLGSGETLLDGDLSTVFDLAAIGGAVLIGTHFKTLRGRQVYLFGAYAALLAWTAKELYPFEQGQAFMSLAFGVEGTVLLVAGLLMHRTILQQVGMGTLLLVVVKVLAVDLGSVEPIWRVLLLFVFAMLFLLLSKFVQGRRRSRGAPSQKGGDQP